MLSPKPLGSIEKLIHYTILWWTPTLIAEPWMWKSIGERTVHTEKVWRKVWEAVFSQPTLWISFVLTKPELMILERIIKMLFGFFSNILLPSVFTADVDIKVHLLFCPLKLLLIIKKADNTSCRLEFVLKSQSWRSLPKNLAAPFSVIFSNAGTCSAFKVNGQMCGEHEQMFRECSERQTWGHTGLCQAEKFKGNRIASPEQFMLHCYKGHKDGSNKSVYHWFIWAPSYIPVWTSQFLQSKIT